MRHENTHYTDFFKKFLKSTSAKFHEYKKSTEKRFSCRFCEESFNENHHLITHVRIHTGEKPFNCNYCDQTFTQSGSVKIHERIHTREKPFGCKFCDKKFTQSYSAKIHERTCGKTREY